MGIAFDATVGGASANAYPTLAQANTYHSENLNRTTWTATDNNTKLAAIVMATRLIDASFDWYGSKSTTTQRLRHPRIGLVNLDGEALSSTVIAEAVLQATSELAFWLLVSDRLADHDNAELSKIVLTPIELEFKHGSRTNPIPDVVIDMVSGYGVSVAESATLGLTRA